MNDCVNLAGDLAKDCGLRLSPGWRNHIASNVPSNFVYQLVKENEDRIPLKNNLRPFPWMVDRQITQSPITVSIKRIKCLNQRWSIGDKISANICWSDGSGGRSSMWPDIEKRLRNGESLELDQQVYSMQLNRGCAVSIQVWDDKQREVSDLLFDWCFSTASAVEFSHKQIRRSKMGIKSEYEVTIDIK